MYEIKLIVKGYENTFYKIHGERDLSVKDGFLMLTDEGGIVHSYNKDFIVGYAVREIEEGEEEK